MAKTNWTMGQTVQPADMNQIGQEINASTTAIQAATPAATGNTLVQRDASGRFKAAAPSAADDVARKAEIDALVPIDGSKYMTGNLNILKNEPRIVLTRQNGQTGPNAGMVVFDNTTAEGSIVWDFTNNKWTILNHALNQTMDIVHTGGGQAIGGLLTLNSLLEGNRRFRKLLGSFTTAQGTNNEKIDIIFPNQTFRGYIDVTIVGGFDFGNSVGTITKRFTLQCVQGGAIHSQTTRYTEVLGPIRDVMAMSDITWDAANSRFRIQIAEVPSSYGNSYSVFIEAQHTDLGSAFTQGATLGTVYSTDTTVFPLPVVTYQGSLAVGTSGGRITAPMVNGYTWATMSSGVNGNGLYGSNCYIDHLTGELKYKETHVDLGARGILMKYEGLRKLYWFDTGLVPTTAGQVFTPVLREIITSLGGQVINGSFTASGLIGRHDNAALTAQNNTNHNMQVNIAYDHVNGYGWIQSINQGVEYATLALNPSGGKVTTKINVLDDGTGAATFGRTSGGTHNGNSVIQVSDILPGLLFRSGSITKTQVLADVQAGNVYLDATNFFFRNAPNSGANVFVIENSGKVSTENNVVDDGAGNMTVAGTINQVGALSSLQTTNKGNVVAAINELFQSASNGKSTVAAAITGMGQAASGSDTYAQLASKISAISTDANAAVGEVLTSRTFYQGGVKRTGTMPNRGATNLTPSGTGTVAIPAGYHNGSGVVAQVSVPAGNVLTGTTIAGVAGTMPNNGAPTITPGTSNQGIGAGYYSGGTVVGDPDLVSSNIKAGINIFGVPGSSTVVDTANGYIVSSNDILTGRSAYYNGQKWEGSMPDRGAPTWTPGTSNQGLAAGYYSGGTVLGDPELVASNIRSGVNIFGVIGSLIEGKRSASGSINTGVDGFYDVTGLNFTPSIILAATAPAFSTKEVIMYYNGYNQTFVPIGGSAVNSSFTNITSSGFRINNAPTGYPMNWFAVE